MSGNYDDMQGSPMDVRDHPADSGHTATQHYAGDVVRFPIQGRGIAERAKASGQSFEDATSDYLHKSSTQDTLGRALGRDTIIPLIRPQE